MDAVLTPKQADVKQRVLAVGETVPVVDADLAARVQEHLETGLVPIAGAYSVRDRLWLDKRKLSIVHECEGKFVASLDAPFAWTSATCRGTVAHRAIRRVIALPELAPLDASAGAIADEIAEHEDKQRAGGRDTGPGVFLASLAPGPRAELMSDVAGIVTQFLADFPPVARSWRPLIENRTYFDVCDGRVRLASKPDLKLGYPNGMIPRMVIVDFKTGSDSPLAQQHALDELRFYALVETLRSGVPPRRVVPYYLDNGSAPWEAVTEEVLLAAVRRVVEGAAKLARLEADPTSASLSPGHFCGWCDARAHCETGQDFVAKQYPTHDWLDVDGSL